MPRQGLNPRQAETVARLLDAAEQELAAVGPEGLTIRTVAGRAGVSSATAYTYFSSRNHLFAELFHRKVLLEHPVEIEGSEPIDRVTCRDPAPRHRARQQAAPGRRGQPRAARHRPRRRAAPRRHRRRDRRSRFERALGDGADAQVLDALTLALTGALLQTGMGLISYDHLADRLDAVMATILKGNA